jgi:N-acetylmuramoyl-L-alanine amidase
MLRARVSLRIAGAVGLAVISALASVPPALAGSGERFDVVVIDAGHGGEDEGAISASGLREKDIVLDVARRLARRLDRPGLRVVLTRESDVFVPLEERTAIANDARGDLFVSIHANASPEPEARGIETYFLAATPSDAAAGRVASRENEAFSDASVQAAQADDPLLSLLGDLMHTEYIEESNAFAKLVQESLGKIDPEHSRGVRQAPFVVLLSVQMPSLLVEIGFLSNREEAALLARSRRREQLVEALERAILEFGKQYDARRGATREAQP